MTGTYDQIPYKFVTIFTSLTDGTIATKFCLNKAFET